MLERNLPVESLMAGEIVAPEKRYITREGYWHEAGKAFKILRINRKSITLQQVMKNLGNQPRVCHIPRPALVATFNLNDLIEEPLFARCLPYEVLYEKEQKPQGQRM